MRLSLILLIVLLLDAQAYGQMTDWTSYAMRKMNYPEDRYFTGFDSRYIRAGSDLDEIRAQMILQSRVNLSESILLTLKSQAISKMQNVNSVSVEDFSKLSTTSTTVELVDVKTDFVVRRKDKEAMAFAWIEKQSVNSHYEKLSESLEMEVVALLERADTYKIDNSLSDALSAYQKANIAITRLKDAATILLAVGESDFQKNVQKKALMYETQCSQAIKGIASLQELSLDQMTELSAFSLSTQLPESIKKISFDNIKFQSTSMTSPFSLKLQDLMQSKASNNGFSVGVLDNPDNDAVVAANYWDEGEQLRVIFNVYNLKGQWRDLIGSVEGWVSKESLDKMNLEWKIEKQEEAVGKMIEFDRVPLVNAGMNVEVWTNRGKDGATFKEGDYLKMYVRVSKPGYLRLMNYWADGSKLMLLDNYYISENKVGEVIELDANWETSCPCGVEFIQLNGQNEPFEGLKVERIDGFDFVLESLTAVIRKTRGFKPKLEQDGNYMGEARITVTTLPAN